jgi:RHS repeat-associated protein
VYTNNQASGNSYDASGNITALGSTNGTALAYDAESRQIQATEPPSSGGGTETYSYDGNGRRVVKSGPSGTVVYAYDAFGQLAYEVSSASATPECTTCYLSPDHLGTSRLTTDNWGNVISLHDYLPFGEEIPSGFGGRTSVWSASADGITRKFTGKERDQETGLDYFGARYYGSALGRFTSPDRIIVNDERLLDPQRFDLYAYARNNPFKFIDPTGDDIVENVDDRYQKRYQRWKSQLLSTSEGQRLWDKFANDHSINVNISVSRDGQNGAVTTPIRTGRPYRRGQHRSRQQHR